MPREKSMTHKTEDLSFDEFDDINYPRENEPEFTSIADRVISRRKFVGSTAALGATAFVLGAGVSVPRAGQAAVRSTSWLRLKLLLPTPLTTSRFLRVSAGTSLRVGGTHFGRASRTLTLLLAVREKARRLRSATTRTVWPCLQKTATAYLP